MSKTELVGPSHSMKDTMDFASQVLGSRRKSSSTLSQGIAVQLMV